MINVIEAEQLNEMLHAFGINGHKCKADVSCLCQYMFVHLQSKKISNDQELIQSDPISCPQNQKGNN